MSDYILITGSVAFDFIMDFPGVFADNIDPKKIHILNISFLVDSLKKEKGGTAGNIAYTLSLLKKPVSILATVGQDFKEYNNFLSQAGVDTKHIKVIKAESTSQAFMVTDKNDNQITAFYPGAMNMADKLRIKTLPKKPLFVLISPTKPEAMVNFASECQKLKIPYLFDPGMQLPRLSRPDLVKGLRGAEILIGNDYEIGLLKSKSGLATREILRNIKVLITTLGPKGSIIETAKEKIIIPAGKPKKVIDPTGAGDAYRAGFITGFLKDLDLQTCGQMGSIAACFAVENYGTTNHSFSLPQFCKRYKDNFGKGLKL